MLDQLGQVAAESAAGVLHLIPNAKAGAPTSIGITFGGANLASSIQAFGSSLGSIASLHYTAGSMSATLGSYQRRWEEWKLQETLANRELKQIDKQIDAADLSCLTHIGLGLLQQCLGLLFDQGLGHVNGIDFQQCIHGLFLDQACDLFSQLTLHVGTDLFRP